MISRITKLRIAYNMAFFKQTCDINSFQSEICRSK